MRLRMISRLIVISLVVIVALIAILHQAFAQPTSHAPAAHPTPTPHTGVHHPLTILAPSPIARVTYQ